LIHTTRFCMVKVVYLVYWIFLAVLIFLCRFYHV
jgi:hypothetical protein